MSGLNTMVVRIIVVLKLSFGNKYENGFGVECERCENVHKWSKS